MKLIVLLALLCALLLALFLWFRPVLAGLGTPVPPEVSGQADPFVPDGTAGGGVIPVAVPTVTGAGAARTTAAEAARVGVTHADEVERLILAAVNAERAKAKQAALQPEPVLQETARSHSDDMLVRNFFAHDDPDGLSSADRIEARHRRMIGLTGENIWSGSNVDSSNAQKFAEQVMRDWMSSTGHRANILKPEFTHLGVGVALKGRDARATQNFGAIRALTDTDIPLQVKNGAQLDLAATAASGGVRPERYDLFLSDKGMAVGGARDLGDGVVKMPSGSYKLRFYFPQAGGYTIYWGPQIEVR